jgi:hypothetical protein
MRMYLMFPSTKYQRVSEGTTSFRKMNMGRWVTVIGIPGNQNIVDEKRPDELYRGKAQLDQGI